MLYQGERNKRGVNKMKEAKIATRTELDALAKRIKSKSQAFGKGASDKFAREAEARLDRFCKGTKA